MNEQEMKKDQERRKANARAYNLKNWWKHLLGGIGLIIVGSVIKNIFTSDIGQGVSGLIILIGFIIFLVGCINGIRKLTTK